MDARGKPWVGLLVAVLAGLGPVACGSGRVGVADLGPDQADLAEVAEIATFDAREATDSPPRRSGRGRGRTRGPGVPSRLRGPTLRA